jgi:hypothetical protein
MYTAKIKLAEMDSWSSKEIRVKVSKNDEKSKLELKGGKNPLDLGYLVY